MAILRKVLFWVCVGAYLIVCPLTILYALGYVITPGAARGLVKTGLIHLATTPPGAAIYVEQRRYTGTTPASIRGLPPGHYQIVLTLPDHEPWSRRVSVEPEKATVLDTILLLPQSWRPRALLSDAFDDLLPVPATPYIILARQPTLGGMAVYDVRSGERRMLVDATSPYAGGELTWQATVKGSAVWLCRVRGRTGDRSLLIDLEHPDAGPRDVTSVLPMKPLRVTWDPRAPTQLFTLQEGYVNRVDTEALAVYPRLAERVQGYGLLHHALYVLTEDLAVQRLDRQGRQVETLFANPVAAKHLFTSRNFFGVQGLFDITPLSEEFLLCLGERGELVAPGLPERLVDAGVRGFAFDAPHRRLLIWRRDEIGVLDLPGADDVHATNAPAVAVRWVWREGHDIAQAFWVHDGSYALLRDQQTVFLLELDRTDGSALHRVVQVRSGSAVAYVEEAGTLYYLDAETGRLSALEVVPRRALALPSLPTSADHELSVGGRPE